MIKRIWKITAASKNMHIGLHSDVYQSIWFKVSMMIDVIKLYILTLVLRDADLDSRSQECEKAKNFCGS